MATTDDILDLRRRVEALEARATEPAQQRPIKPRIGVLNASIKASMDRIQALVADLPEPPLPPADRPLWEVMERIFYENGSQDRDDWVATINAVAEWLLADHPAHATAASRLHAEARRAREGRKP